MTKKKKVQPAYQKEEKVFAKCRSKYMVRVLGMLGSIKAGLWVFSAFVKIQQKFRVTRRLEKKFRRQFSSSGFWSFLGCHLFSAWHYLNQLWLIELLKTDRIWKGRAPRADAVPVLGKLVFIWGGYLRPWVRTPSRPGFFYRLCWSKVRWFFSRKPMIFA